MKTVLQKKSQCCRKGALLYQSTPPSLWYCQLLDRLSGLCIWLQGQRLGVQFPPVPPWQGLALMIHRVPSISAILRIYPRSSDEEGDNSHQTLYLSCPNEILLIWNKIVTSSTKSESRSSQCCLAYTCKDWTKKGLLCISSFSSATTSLHCWQEFSSFYQKKNGGEQRVNASAPCLEH